MRKKRISLIATKTFQTNNNLASDKDMTFWEHLEELRGVLIRSAIALIAVAVVVFFFKDILFDFIIFAPTKEDFVLYRFFNNVLGMMNLEPIDPFNLKLVNIELASQFFIHISTTFYMAIVITAPYIFYQLWLFISPALYPKEKKAVKKGFVFASILFYLGVIVGYFVVFPLTIRFLGTYQVSADVPNTISLRSYISMFTSLILIMGIVFELPSLAAILSRLGILTKRVMKKYRRHAFVALLIVAAIITPSGDPFTMMAVGLPLYALYEVSIAVCKNSRKEDVE